MTTWLKTFTCKFAYLSILAGMLFFLPYLVPVARTNSLSYVVGYNNRIALLIFTVGALLYAYLTRDDLPDQGAADPRPLPLRALAIGLIVVAVACVVQRLKAPYPGLEAQYSLNRVQMLASGLRPYRDFEYAYGPLHLYVPLLISRLARCSVGCGYYTWWGFQWSAGVAMLWAVVRFIEVPCRRRLPLYVALLATRLPDIMGEGIAYTPVRIIGAAFFLMVVASIWSRTRSSFLTVAAALASIVIELGVSPEQGIGVAVGLSAWLLILFWKRLFSWPALGLFVAALAIIFGVSLRSGFLNTLKSFAGGAYGLPLVPSVPVALILFTYVVAFSAATREILRGQATNTSLPMVLGGLALLPVAFGRCDLGHLELASGALLIGIAWIESYPTLRRWWSPLALLYFVLLPAFFFMRGNLPMSISERLHLTKPEPRPANLEVLNAPPPRPGGEPGGPLPLKVPCAVIYRVVNVWPDYTHVASDNCLETGYYISDRNFFTDAAVERRIEELATHAGQPLLLTDVPLDHLMTAFDIDPTVMKWLVRALYVPRVKNRPFSYQALTDYIQEHYVPASEPMGSYRVWYPKATRSLPTGSVK